MILSAVVLLFALSAAQPSPGGPCGMVADAAVAPARAVQGFNIPSMQSCAVDDGASTPITILHITGPIDTTGVSIPGAPAAAAAIESTPVDGFGDSAVLLRIPVGEGTLVSLRVQRGAEVYAFNSDDAPDTPDRLMSLARIVLGMSPS